MKIYKSKHFYWSLLGYSLLQGRHWLYEKFAKM